MSGEVSSLLSWQAPLADTAGGQLQQGPCLSRQIRQVRLPRVLSCIHLQLPAALLRTDYHSNRLAALHRHIISAMLHTYLAVPAFPVTSAAPDVSRPSLKRLARWIRDDLEIHVARDGPGALRPDDVVTLHEHFVALRRSPTITAHDLRATGIHKAVKEIAGIATRWPGRLCDECDKIIAVWTDKFGPLDNLPPLLYGRGGRLEGIATFNESTTEVSYVCGISDHQH